MNFSRLSVLVVFFMMIMSAFVAIPTYNVGADEHDEGAGPESFHLTLEMNTLEEWTVTFEADMPTDWSDEMREDLAGMCAELGGENDGEWISG